MIVTTSKGVSVDTETDLSAPERHVLQKLFLWRSMAESLGQFRLKKEQALLRGWNNSGPIVESPSLRIILQDLEGQVAKRLHEDRPFPA